MAPKEKLGLDDLARLVEEGKIDLASKEEQEKKFEKKSGEKREKSSTEQPATKNISDATGGPVADWIKEEEERLALLKIQNEARRKASGHNGLKGIEVESARKAQVLAETNYANFKKKLPAENNTSNEKDLPEERVSQAAEKLASKTNKEIVEGMLVGGSITREQVEKNLPKDRLEELENYFTDPSNPLKESVESNTDAEPLTVAKKDPAEDMTIVSQGGDESAPQVIWGHGLEGDDTDDAESFESSQHNSSSKNALERAIEKTEKAGPLGIALTHINERVDFLHKKSSFWRSTTKVVSKAYKVFSGLMGSNNQWIKLGKRIALGGVVGAALGGGGLLVAGGFAVSRVLISAGAGAGAAALHERLTKGRAAKKAKKLYEEAVEEKISEGLYSDSADNTGYQYDLRDREFLNSLRRKKREGQILEEENALLEGMEKERSLQAVSVNKFRKKIRNDRENLEKKLLEVNKRNSILISAVAGFAASMSLRLGPELLEALNVSAIESIETKITNENLPLKVDNTLEDIVSTDSLENDAISLDEKNIVNNDSIVVEEVLDEIAQDSTATIEEKPIIETDSTVQEEINIIKENDSIVVEEVLDEIAQDSTATIEEKPIIETDSTVQEEINIIKENDSIVVEEVLDEIAQDSTATIEEKPIIETDSTVQEDTESINSDTNKISPEAYVKKGDGITQILKRQFNMEGNIDLAKKFGIETGSPEEYAKLAKEFGILNETQEIRLNLDPGSAYVPKIDAAGNPIIEQFKDGKLVDTYKLGDKFEIEIQENEYIQENNSRIKNSTESVSNIVEPIDNNVINTDVEEIASNETIESKTTVSGNNVKDVLIEDIMDRTITQIGSFQVVEVNGELTIEPVQGFTFEGNVSHDSLGDFTELLDEQAFKKEFTLEGFDTAVPPRLVELPDGVFALEVSSPANIFTNVDGKELTKKMLNTFGMSENNTYTSTNIKDGIERSYTRISKDQFNFINSTYNELNRISNS